MTAPAAELQKAIFAALSADATLVGLLAGAKVYDQAPPHAGFPYITFGRTSIYDWSTGTESGVEQLFTLHVWSKAKGRNEALQIMDRIHVLLDDAALPMAGQDLVSLRQEFAEARFDDDLMLYHGLLRFRATIETPG